MSVCSQWGPRVTIAHDALDLTVQGPQPYPRLHSQALVPALDMGPHCTGPQCPPTTSSPRSLDMGPGLEICSNLFTWDPSHQYQHLVPKTGNLFKLVHLRIPPPVLTSGSTYGQHNGTPPTAVLSCLVWSMEIMHEDVYHDSMIDQF